MRSELSPPSPCGLPIGVQTALTVLDMVTTQQLTPVVEAVYDLTHYRQAFINLATGQRFGKIITSR